MKLKLKIKFNLKQKSIFSYIYIVFLLINCLVLFYLYNFFNEQVYSAIFADQAMIEAQARQSSENINMEKFDLVIAEIKKKEIH